MSSSVVTNWENIMQIGKIASVVVIVALGASAAVGLQGEPVAPAHEEHGSESAGPAPAPERATPHARTSPSGVNKRTPQPRPTASFEALLEEARALDHDERKARLADLDGTLDGERWVERANEGELAPDERAELTELMRARNALSVAQAEALLASLRTDEGDGE